MRTGPWLAAWQRTLVEQHRAELSRLGPREDLREEICDHVLRGEVAQHNPLGVDALADVVVLDEDVPHARGGVFGNALRRLVVRVDERGLAQDGAGELLLELAKEHEFLCGGCESHVLRVGGGCGHGGLQLGVPGHGARGTEDDEARAGTSRVNVGGERRIRVR